MELGAKHALRLAAAFELGREVERTRQPPRPHLLSPEEVHRLLAPEVRGLGRETFHVLLLDARHRLQGRVRVSEGTLSTSLVHPREVFGPALRGGAAAVIVAHNHPSGDPRPSAEDVSVTRRLQETGRLVGIPLLDHVVIGDGCWASVGPGTTSPGNSSQATSGQATSGQGTPGLGTPGPGTPGLGTPGLGTSSPGDSNCG